MTRTKTDSTDEKTPAAGMDLERPVDLVVSRSVQEQSGIGRYAVELQRALLELGVNARRTDFRYLPLSDRRPILRTLPIGVDRPSEGQIYHLPNTRSAAVFLTSRRLRPSVVTVHDIGALFNPDDHIIGSRIGRTLLRVAWQGMKRADHLIAVSDFTRNGLIDAGFAPDRITTVHEGVDLDRFRPVSGAAAMIRDRYEIDMEQRPSVLYVGNEFPRKNLKSLVRALGKVKRAGVPIQWIKIGSHGYAAGRDLINRLIAEEGLTGDVHFLDRVSDEELPAFYSAATAYVHPSKWEGFGFPVLEAMACGTPVISSNAASLPEVCGDAALLIDPEDIAGWVDAIERVATDRSLRKKLFEAGQSRANQFTWRATALSTRDIYAVFH